MSDLRFHDAAVIWIDDNELHGTFHHSCWQGYESLTSWMMQQPPRSPVCGNVLSKRLDIWQKVFHEDHAWVCDWCREDQHFCECEVDANGLVWTKHGVGIPFEDWDMPF